MKNRFYNFYIKSAVTFTLLIFISCLGYSQIRKGSIDMTGDEGRLLSMNDGMTFTGEGGEISFEAWVYVKDDGSGSDFTLFQYHSGPSQIQISYNGDQNKGTSQAWYIETFALPEKGFVKWNWYIDYKSGFSAPDFANSWHHVAFTCNSKSSVKLYIDGEDASGTKNCTHNGSSFEMFHDTWGAPYQTYIGGKSNNYDLEGKLYVGEIRVWDAQLSASEVAKYYDEEVNKAHPEWNNLVRYYHGTESSGTGSSRTFEDRSANTEYDAKVGSDDISVSSANTPPVKPPSFNDSDFSNSISTNTCQASDIDVSWTNLRTTGTSNYTSYNNTSNHSYNMVVTRESDGKVISDGTGTSKSDTDVEEGFKDRYIIQTYWKIDGVAYYSDDSKTSSYGTIKEQFEAPSSFTVSTDKCDKSIDLSWSASDGTPPNWTIQRSTSSNFSSGVSTLLSTLSGSTNSYTASNQSIETNLYFRVYASGKDDNGCTVSGATSSIETGFTSYPPSTPTNGTITQDLAAKTLKLNWSNPGGNNADSWIIKRSKFDGSSEVEFTTALGTTNYDDADLELCETYSYTLGAVNECATEGVFATTDLTGNISTDLSGAIATMEATKGYLSDAVQVEWSLNGSLSSIDRFRLYRSRADKNNFSLIKVLDNDLIYTDETALGGVFYNYKVVGEAACNDNTIYTNEGIDMGFVIPYGVANGHIEYDGGNAVEGVTVSFEKSDGATGHSLAFDGVNDYVKIDDALTVNNTSFTIEFWEKNGNTSGESYIIGTENLPGSNNNKAMHIGYRNATNFTFAFYGNDDNVAVENDGEWHHWACVYDKDASGLNRFIYRDGELVSSKTSSSDFLGTGNLAIGKVSNSRYFNGNVDEVRIWNVARSEEEISQNYNRLLNGSEDGLIAYYRCDEGIGSNVYDASKTDDEHNKNDGTFINETTFSEEIPNSDQLGIKGITDEYGDYTVSYIPYSSGGEIFRVTPSLGQHAFEPNSRTVYVGDGAQTQNGLDFTDISSFKVTGKVTYKNTQVPVEGVSILLDGAEVLGDDNQVIRTDADGNYEVNVPIGRHYLSTYKDGHVFAEGFFPPLDAFGSIAKYEFVEDLIVNFTDSTKVKVAGRIVGGSVEGDKTIGFGLSVNNIGVADLSFKLLKDGYDIDTEDSDIYNVINLTTDPHSGEYEIELIPESWVVQKAGNDNYFIDEGELSTLDLSDALVETTVTNIAEDGTEESYSYHQLLNYIIREQPVITVTDDQYEAFDGDTLIVFTNQVTNESDTLILGSESDLNFPVFQMGKSYTAIVNINEYYNNPNHPDGPIADVVPVEGATVTIVDNMAILPGTSVDVTDAYGELSYGFIAGVPSLIENGEESYTKSLEVYADVDGTSIAWGDSYRAYVLGNSPLEGTDFVSSGPDVPEIILRDPPGSNSYAYIEKGSTFSEATNYTMSTNSLAAVDLNIMAGVKVEFGGGLAGPVVEAELTNNTSAGISVLDSYNEAGEYSREVTFTERIETSSDPDDVGSPADLYIGKSYNIFYTKSKNFKILPTDFCIDNGLTFVGDSASEYCLGLIDGFVINDDGASTYFIYSQRHIMNELIPNLFELRNSLLLTPDYVSHLTVESPFYGMNNDDPAIQDMILDTIAQNPSADVSELVYSYVGSETDQVRFYNNQITLWLNAIAINEAEKASAEVVRNISIDGTAGSFTSEIEEVYSSEYNYLHARDIYVGYEQEFGATVNDNGASISVSGDLGYEVIAGGGNSTDNSLLFGYVIEDEDESDYYSIDVLKSNGVAVFADNDFSSNSENSGDYINDLTSDKAGNSVLGALTDNVTESLVVGTTAISSGISVAKTVGTQIFSMIDMSKNALNLADKINENSTYDISGFKISSPIFSVKGGQTKCPYHDEEYASFYVDASGEIPLLNTGTIRREIPIINVTPAIRNNVPDNQSATFTLQLQNGSDALGEFYEIMIDESTNPDGLELMIDGLTAERAFYIDPSSTVEKTLTVRKTKEDVMDYDSVAVLFRSGCQFDPTNAAADIADTVYISVHFLPSCSNIEISSMVDNWIVNYENNDQATITLEGYDLNLSTLEKIDFQYKTLSGSPLTAMAWYADTSSNAYHDYNGDKALLESSASSFIWNVEDLTDRSYQLRARAVCTDGSVTESEYLTGVMDRTTIVAFGTPEPTDGILDPSDDILVRFNEELEAGLVKDHNISVRSVLNGADVSHSTSVKFNGVNEYARVPSISFNNKPFTVEYWLKREVGAAGTVFSKGAGGEQLSIAFNADETIDITIGTQVINVDPTSYYTSVTPADAWHHWALAYDNAADELSFYMDDELLLTKSNVLFSPRDAGNAYLARDVAGTSYLAAQIHEFRIWEEARSLSESVAYMSETLSGSEIGLYGYWPMDDGNGSLVLDKTAGRNMVIDGEWELYPGSDAYAFDGATQYLFLDGTNVTISNETDFTVEFWFKAATPVATQTIFSSGKGDGSDTLASSTEYALSINATPSGQLEIESNGGSFVATSTNYLDNQWHHFALVVDRQSTARTYVDGALQNSSSNSGIQGLAGAELWLGARGYKPNAITVEVDQHFAGQLDEFRIWNAARSVDYIELYKNTKLEGDEAGLICYLPFEEYNEVMGTVVRSTTLSDEATPLFLTQAVPATATGGENFVSGASIRDVRPLQDIAFDYVVNGDEIVITPLIDAYRIEGQTLEISVSDLFDLNGNRQLSTVSWTAYVQQNELVWTESTIAVEQESGTSTTFTATVSNLGGVAYSYTLENMPSWLSSNATTGSVSPNSNKTITFTVNGGLNVGYYEQNINLTTSLDFDEKLNIQVSVKEEAPDWSLNTSDYQFSMNVFGRLSIEDVISTDENDLVAAFVNDEPRGVANIEYVAQIDGYLLFLTIYSNTQNGEDIELRVWDASEAKVHEDVSPDLTFEVNSIVGSSAIPQDIVASNATATTFNFEPGWTWVSFNLESDDLASVNTIFTGAGVQDDIVKGQDAFDIYDDATGWLGELSLVKGGLQVEEMYKVYLKEGGSIKYSGTPVDALNTPISVEAGWNYIGYTPQVSMTIQEAMVGITPSSGDLLKSHNQFAMYDNLLGWVGTLKNLTPNSGYMFSSSNAGTFTYPENSSLSSARLSSVNFESPSPWQVNASQYADNMSIVAEVELAAQNWVSGDETLVAYVNGEVRGYANAEELSSGKIMYFLTVFGKQDDDFVFKLHNPTTGKSTTVENGLSYEVNAVVGTTTEPYPLRLGAFTFAGNSAGASVTPNPFGDKLTVNVACEGTVQVELLSIIGVSVLSTTIEGSGTIGGFEELSAGKYLIKMTTDCGVYTEQLIKY